MQELLKKIEVHAQTRLTLPPGKQATQELARYKTFLKLETHRLKMLHRAGVEGLEICHARSFMLDQILRTLWSTAKNSLSAEALEEFPAMALVAIGGYGRGELNPHSDIDFMFLHDGQIAASKPLPHLSRLLDGILYPLWDIGLKIGHSVRTIEECVKVANADMQSKTSVIEARLVAGDEALFQKFQKVLIDKCIEDHDQEYFALRLQDQTARRAKFGNSACMQEPNLKNGCGGLRDFQNLLWMAFFKHHTCSLKDLQSNGFLSSLERRQLQEAYDYLLRVRTEVHYLTNRPIDALTKSIQPTVAWNLGYKERSPSQRIERFMRVVYTHMRNVLIITRTLEQRLALQPKPKSRLSLRALLPDLHRHSKEPIDGFIIVDGQLHAATPKVFREQPRRLMRVFLYAQQRGLQIHPDTAQLIRNQLSLVDRSFQSDERVRETFLSILNQRGSVAPILRAMHEVGLLGKYMPEFGRLTCLVQHEFFHQYAADEHTLMCLEQLDRIWKATEPPYVLYLPLFQKLERPHLLYLALLLHDTGKPKGHGNHSEVSAQLASRVSRRLDLDAAATHTLQQLIINHLLMASVSQRRDMDDPAVIRHFAKQLETPELVNLLTLLTFVDSQATSDKLWNGFKDTLLWELRHKALELMSGSGEFGKLEEKQRQELLGQVIKLAPDSLSEEEAHAHFGTLPPRYFQIHSAREILDDLLLSHRFMRLQISEEESALAPVVNWHNEPDRGVNTVKICTWDRAGLFRKIAASLSATGLNILSAQIFTRSDGIVLDTLYVVDAKTGSLAGPEQRDQFEKILTKTLQGQQLDFPALIARHKVSRPLYQAYSGEHLPTRVRFDNNASDTRSCIEVETEDRLGLLWRMAQALTDLALNICGAKICTERGAAIDTFYVRERDGSRVLDPERQRAIERRLRQAITTLDLPSK